MAAIPYTKFKVLQERTRELEAENAKLRAENTHLHLACRQQENTLLRLSAQKPEPGIHYCGHCGKPCRCEDDPWVRREGDCDCSKEDSRLMQENAKLRERVADGESTIKLVDAQYTKLRAELERRKLKWQTGPVARMGYYLRWLKGSKRIELIGIYDGDDARYLSEHFQWAGPIAPPEEE